MATIDPVRTLAGNKDGNCVEFFYEQITAADTGAPFSLPDFTKVSVGVAGAFGGGNVPIQGSNDGVTWGSLTDLAGNAIAPTAAGFFSIAGPAKFMRVGQPGGTAVDVDVTFLAVREISVRA